MPVHKTIHHYVKIATNQLKSAKIDSPRLDSEILMSHLLGADRTFIHAHSNHELSEQQVKIYMSMVNLRSDDRVPVAYLVGYKEFYHRKFAVNTDVLIPRPESEDLIDIVKSLNDVSTVLDIGTGSGAIGVTLKLENKNLQVTLSDISDKALLVAGKNSKQLGAEVDIVKSDLLKSKRLSKHKFDLIVANLPYVDKNWTTSPEIKHEPSISLFASDGGLAVIYELLKDTSHSLSDDGYILLEADPKQHAKISEKAILYDLRTIKSNNYALLLQLR